MNMENSAKELEVKVEKVSAVNVHPKNMKKHLLTVRVKPSSGQRSQTWPRRKKILEDNMVTNNGSRPCTCCGSAVEGDVRKLFDETDPAVWLSAEGGSRRQAWRIVTMATRLLVSTGPVVLPIEYLFYPLQGVVKAMDRFIPSSKQPQHWSRNFNGTHERRRSNARRRGSPEAEGHNAVPFTRGVTLRAEDLLGESENRLVRDARIQPTSFLLSPRPGDRRAGGSATEVATERPRAPVRRCSEGSRPLRRRRSSSSSNAADDPTSSEPASSSSLSSSSESGCNGDSETCNYCRLSESSDSYDCRDSTDDERSSSSLEGNDRRPRRLSRALSEECPPPSRPVRRTSPGEYLRHKRHQMERLRNERRFQRCDSDPRLHRSSHQASTTDPPFISPTRLRPSRRAETPRPQRSALAQKMPPADRSSRRSSLRSCSGVQQQQSQEEQQEEPFLRCCVCEGDLPPLLQNCVLCSSNGTQLQGIVVLEEVRAVGEEELQLVQLQEKQLEDEKELEEFYDLPTSAGVTSPPVETESKKAQWRDVAAHKSFNVEELHRTARRRSAQLRKYNSEPVPQRSYDSSQTERPTSSDTSQSRAESSCSSSSRSEKKSGYHVVKDSPKKVSLSTEEESVSSCQTCEKTTEEESEKTAKSNYERSDSVGQDKNLRKSPVFLKPEFVFEPEIIHKANPLVDEAEVEVMGTAGMGAFRRLSEDEFISTLNIHDAARKGDLHVVKLLTKKDPKQMETVDERGWTPIHLAAAHGHAEVVKYLAMEGAHLAALDPSSYTAVHLAAMNGHSNCLEVLLPMGVNIDCLTSEGFTALHLAVMNGHCECIQTLLQWGSSMDKRDALGRGVYEMVEEYNLEEVASLLRRFHKKMHNFKHVLDMINRSEDRNTSDIPPEYMAILASIAEESGTE